MVPATGLVVLSLGAALLGGCTINPATGKRQLTLISESEEIALGRQADEQLVESMGLYEDEELREYVSSLGQRLAAISERPDLPWTFRLVDDSVVNAFALPGGFIYVTRGILAHFNSEAELVGVLGHEIGHVTARHSVNQLSKQTLAQAGLGIGGILVPEVRGPLGDLLQTGVGLLFLKYSRDDERQADSLGVRYTVRAGYDPRSLGEVFDVLARVSEESGAGSVPGWLSTHPAPENRQERLENELARLDRPLGELEVGVDDYLRRLDGMVFGDDPREGFFRDHVFYHPDLAFRFEFPPGWDTQNRPDAVIAISDRRNAVVQLTLAEEGTAGGASDRFFAQSGVYRRDTTRRSIHGLEAVVSEFQASTQGGLILGYVAHVEYDGRVYQLLAYSLESVFSSYDATFRSSLGTFAPVNDPQILDVEPRRLEIVEIERAMSLEEFAKAYPSSVDLEKLALLNHVESDQTLEAGRLVKRVTGHDPSK